MPRPNDIPVVMAIADSGSLTWLRRCSSTAIMIGTISANNDNEIGRMDRGSNAEGPNHQQPLTAFETHNGRWTFAAGTALHAPELTFDAAK